MPSVSVLVGGRVASVPGHVVDAAEPDAPAAETGAVVAPPRPPVMDLVAVYDQRFIANMIAHGWYVTDPATFAMNAHRVCAMFEAGATPEYVNSRLVADTGMAYSDALIDTSTAMLTYPNCP